MPVGNRTLVVATEDVVFGDVAVVIMFVRMVIMNKKEIMVGWPPICRPSL